MCNVQWDCSWRSADCERVLLQPRRSKQHIVCLSQLSVIHIQLYRRVIVTSLELGMLHSFFFSKFEFRPLKFGLNSNFVYIFVEKL